MNSNQVALNFAERKKVGGLIAIIFLIAISLIVAGCTTQHATPTNSNTNPINSNAPNNSPIDASVNAHPVDIAVNNTKPAQIQQQELLANVIADGTYKDNVTYQYHSGSELIEIDITVQNDTITDASIIPHNPNPVSARYIAGVNAALPELVIGKKIDQLNIPHQVSGSSLTTAAFKQQIADLIAKY